VLRDDSKVLSAEDFGLIKVKEQFSRKDAKFIKETAIISELRGLAS
jgi:hypothetical protein